MTSTLTVTTLFMSDGVTMILEEHIEDKTGFDPAGRKCLFSMENRIVPRSEEHTSELQSR